LFADVKLKRGAVHFVSLTRQLPSHQHSVKHSDNCFAELVQISRSWGDGQVQHHCGATGDQTSIVR